MAMLCLQCGETRKDEFYPHNKVRCKWCYARRVAEVYAPRRKAKKAIYQAEYYTKWYQERGRKRAIDYVSNIRLWQRAHPEEVKAKYILEQAIKRGDIIKPEFCSTCMRATRVHGHHPDYSKPLEVLWLCASCHKKIHLRESVNARSY